MPLAEAPLVGHSVGNFRLVAKIGGGGTSEVYLAEQHSVGTRVAIKTLLPRIAANQDHVQRFFNEAIAVSEVRHAGVVRIFDAGFMSCGRAYLVMEYLDGETLTCRIRRAGRLPLAHIAEVARQISTILEATHQAGITHRDLKPDNIFLVPDAELDSGERVKLLDFGIAKLAASRLTSTSIGAMGTPDYMAPEQWH
ncbi:MAG TPA: serine/threonine-protein kinase, partial [Kofleriaceae bacterium]|nr:serine/threonine-protein kinase [Kofleriaceae bacterium]